MQLYTLMFGKSKKRMKPIITDALHKVENYRDARENNVEGWHDIIPAEIGATIWKQQTCSIRGSGNKTNSGPQVVGKGLSGYIGKNGFNPNT